MEAHNGSDTLAVKKHLLKLKTSYSYAFEASTDILFRSAKKLSPCLDSLILTFCEHFRSLQGKKQLIQYPLNLIALLKKIPGSVGTPILSSDSNKRDRSTPWSGNDTEGAYRRRSKEHAKSVVELWPELSTARNEKTDHPTEGIVPCQD